MSSISSSIRRFRKPATVLIAGAMVLTMSGAVGAATPSSGGGIIKACVTKSTKVVRLSIFASPTWCRKTEVYRFWNVTGPTGATGAAGAQGPKGDKGDKGDTGAAGSAGSAGAAGSAGVQGTKGDTGDQGIQGIPGVQGLQGIQGIQGLIGPKGDKGDKGDDASMIGPKGDTGDQGIQGPKGDKGDTGDQGIQGIQGIPGDDASMVGPKGDQGIQGPKGDKGDTGDQGIQGPKGDKGDTGNTGPAGSGLSSVHVDPGTTAGFPGNANLGATVTATATCATGTIVSGGGNITGNNDRHYAAMTSSYPSSATTWTVIATIVAGTQDNGQPPSLTAYALCGA